jgi:hypothetical protein
MGIKFSRSLVTRENMEFLHKNEMFIQNFPIFLCQRACNFTSKKTKNYFTKSMQFCAEKTKNFTKNIIFRQNMQFLQLFFWWITFLIQKRKQCVKYRNARVSIKFLQARFNLWLLIESRSFPNCTIHFIFAKLLNLIHFQCRHTATMVSWICLACKHL